MEEQHDMLDKSKEQKAVEWIHTTAGGQAMNIFIREALRMQKRGFKRIGQRLLAERIRWEMMLEQGPENKADSFKLNNDYVKTMAKYAIQKCPQLDGMFSFREKAA